MTQLHFFCGKMAAGKSTLAKKIAKEHSAILIVQDDWLETLFPNTIVDIPSFVEYSERLNNILFDHVISLLTAGNTLVMDFPANTEKQRLWFREIIDATQVAHTLHFVDRSDEQCKQQLTIRNQDKKEGEVFTSDAEFDAITRFFQPPADNEGFNIIKV